MDRKIILVTGSNKGIGFEIVRQLVKLDHIVILSSRDEGKGKAAIEKLKSENLSVHFVQLDITIEESVIAAVEKVKSQFSRLDVLINNAAILLKDDKSLLHNSWEVTQQTVQADALAQLQVTRYFQSAIPKGGRIIMAPAVAEA